MLKFLSHLLNPRNNLQNGKSMKTFPLFDRKYVDYCWVNMSEYCDISLWWMELSQVPILDDSCEDLLK